MLFISLNLAANILRMLMTLTNNFDLDEALQSVGTRLGSTFLFGNRIIIWAKVDLEAMTICKLCKKKR